MRPESCLPRLRPLAWLAACFLAICLLTRIALAFALPAASAPTSAQWAYAFAVGAGYDLLAFVYFAWPLVLLLAVLPGRWLGRRRGRWPVAALCLALLAVLVFVAVAEWVFWDEFQARFNFIAVDYLVYTTEVIGNIRQSYPVAPLLGGIAAAVAAVFLATARWRRTQADRAGGGARILLVVAWLGLTVAGAAAVDGDMKDRTANQYVNELAGNGLHQFFAAYRASALDYARYYRTMPDDAAFARLRAQLSTPDATFVEGDPDPVARDIRHAGPERRLNVVLISIESLSSSFVGPRRDRPSLTPELDRLAAQSLEFTRLYASGTRTVRGLEALALSVPPTPGESIVKRPHNENLYSLADVFRAKGYAAEFLYGGYGAFDNMSYFFSHNGYAVLDRAAMDADAIHHANAWGVADEDLYTLALDRLDRAHARGQPYFGHVMTTSNHRPYTFPANRVPYPQGERDSAVAYTDWALGDFLRRARTRPWFADTVFVVTADHCASSGGIARLPVFRYHVPLWIHAPAHIAPGRVDRMLAQIDIGPTLLGLLRMDYRSHFYGRDLFATPAGSERALVGNYQRLGLLRGDRLTELAPRRVADNVRPRFDEDGAQAPVPLSTADALDAIAIYQTAAHRYTHGTMAHPPLAPDVVAGVPAPAAARSAAATRAACGGRVRCGD